MELAMDSHQVAAEINALAAQRTHFVETEHVSTYEIQPDEIEKAHQLFAADQPVSDYWRGNTSCSEQDQCAVGKYAKDLTKNWDLFYKDRMWLDKEFAELVSDTATWFATEGLSSSPLLVEVGCGVGNALIPILLHNSKLRAIGFDCSRQAIALLNERWRAISANEGGPWLQPRTGPSRQPILERCGYTSATPDTMPTSAPEETKKSAEWPGGRLLGAEVWDITQGPPPPVDGGCLLETADFVLLLFVLSAIPPIKMLRAARHAAQVLRPGGLLFFRDYARYDMAQLRFARSRRALVQENFYVRQDGTLAYFFLADEVRSLFVDRCGLEELQLSYFLREFVNRKTGSKMRRLWIQGKFRKP